MAHITMGNMAKSINRAMARYESGHVHETIEAHEEVRRRCLNLYPTRQMRHAFSDSRFRELAGASPGIATAIAATMSPS